MTRSRSVGSVLAAALLFSACTSDAAPTEIDVTIVPQNHSGQAFKLRIEILDAAGTRVFDKNYTLSSSDHTGPADAISVTTGSHKVKAKAERTSPGTDVNPDLERSLTIGADAYQLVVVIGADNKLTAEVKER